MQIVPQVYRNRQIDPVRLPRKPWCYWVTEEVQRLFSEHPTISQLYPIDMGLKTSDNFRFVRWWWEVGIHRIGNAISREQAEDSGKKWFMYAKGASSQRYASSVDNVVNWARDGKEIKSFLVEHYPYLKGNTEWCTHNENLYFHPAIIWSAVSSSGFIGRQIPPGVIASNANYGIFAPPDDMPVLLAVMNSLPGRYLIRVLCPTINHNKGDIELFPVPTELLTDQTLRDLGIKAIYLAAQSHITRETSRYFSIPSLPFRTEKLLAEIVERIDDAVFSAFDLVDQSGSIRDFMDQPLPDAEEAEWADSDGVERGAEGTDFPEARHFSWLSYAAGVVVGRFQPGVEGTLGCAIIEDENGEKRHLFSPEVEEALRRLADSDGVAVLDPSHEDDLPRKVEQALLLMLGAEQTREIITTIGGEAHNIEASLRLFLERDFFTKIHLKWYQKRPIYWLLQSPRKTYSVYLYHERVTRDTLPLIRGSRYLEGKINQTRNRLKEVHEALRTAEGKNKRTLEKALETLQTQLTDLEAFDQALHRVLNARNERGETVGWAPEIDDGVILNLAPLHELLPSWKTEPKKYWEGLEKEDYDWSHTAMRYWPDRVLAKCRKNKSYAIAHDRLDVYEGDRK